MGTRKARQSLTYSNGSPGSGTSPKAGSLSPTYFLDKDALPARFSR